MGQGKGDIKRETRDKGDIEGWDKVKGTLSKGDSKEVIWDEGSIQEEGKEKGTIGEVGR